MTTMHVAGLVVAALAWGGAAVAETPATIDRETFACTSWAGWREYTHASLTAGGARTDGRCPIRIPQDARVAVVEEDAGAGASEIRYKSRTWFVDEQRLRK